ncbi:hypothetical protein E2C01_022762 [Portunus trituberculatus]|uniref:Uncharacterized protein n=1 Tax=Portunus trituberculatus TaxID=210409 RepID=A0A5B7E9Q7_PORTR|nr:hypothetical protein [Portunus trituberculatus]
MKATVATMTMARVMTTASSNWPMHSDTTDDTSSSRIRGSLNCQWRREENPYIITTTTKNTLVHFMKTHWSLLRVAKTIHTNNSSNNTLLATPCQLQGLMKQVWLDLRLGSPIHPPKVRKH